MRFLWLLAVGASGLAGNGAVAAPASIAAEPLPPAPGISRTLKRFSGEAEFRRYLRAARKAGRARALWWAGSPRGVQFAEAQPAGSAATDSPPEPVCPPENPDCLPQLKSISSESVVVTGSRVAPHNPSITNVQTIGVDEGDIVKQVGRFLLVLQDGRLFSVDTSPGDRPGLAVADRMNVYRDPKSDTWYDEMLVYGHRVVVTGYSYEEEASELSVLEVGAGGRLTSLGTFFISSNDYYSADNYASRLVGDRLVIYTPLDLTAVDANKDMQWPLVRRWVPGEAREAIRRRGRPLLDARDVFRPVQETFAPRLHTISICPLGPAQGARDLDCRSTGFVGPARAELYVAPDAAYVWTFTGWEDEEAWNKDPRCSGRYGGRQPEAPVYRLPVGGGEPDVLLAHGAPVDHFSLEKAGRSLYALLRDGRFRCERDQGEEDVDWESVDPDLGPPREPNLSFFEAGPDRFAETAASVPARAYAPMPSPGTFYIANRFTDRYLVYGGMSWQGSRPPEWGRKTKPGRAFAVPLRRPQAVAPLTVPHTVIRAERVGDDVVLTGYPDGAGLDVSYVSLRDQPVVASTVQLSGRFESEGRSHAFNSLAEPDGSAVMGVPTVPGERDSERWWWRSSASDVSFLKADSAGRLSGLGELATSLKPKSDGDWIEDQDIPGYSCEVSCVDWYGNTRPIFTDGRVFALTGAELIEGRIEGTRIREVGRLLIAGPTRPRSP